MGFFALAPGRAQNQPAVQEDYFTSEVYERESPAEQQRRGRTRKEKIQRRIDRIEERKRRSVEETRPAPTPKKQTRPAPTTTRPSVGSPPELEPLGDLDAIPVERKLRGSFDLYLQGLYDVMDADKPRGRTRYHETGYVRAKALGRAEYGSRYLARADLRATHYKSNYRRDPFFAEHWLEIDRYDIWQLDGRENASSNALSTAGARELWAKYETRDVSFRAGRQQLDWSENRHFDPFNLVGRHTPFTLLPDELKGSDALSFTGILSKRTAVDLVASFHDSGDYDGAKPNSLYQDAVFRVQSTVIDDFDFTLVGGWKGRRTLGGLELSGDTGDLRYRLGGLVFSPFVLDPDSDNAFIENRFKFRDENKSFGQASGMLEYSVSDGFVPGLAFFYNGGANRFRPTTYRGMTRVTEERPDRDVYDLQRGHINTYRPAFAGLSFTGRPLTGFYYELYVYADIDGRGVMASPLLAYEPNDRFAFKLGGRLYSSVKNRLSDFSYRDNEVFFLAEWQAF